MLQKEREVKKRMLVGAKVGGGPPPGYVWNVVHLSVARDEALKFLEEHQYEHLVDQFKALAREKDPTHPTTVDVTSGCWELRDKGGPLGNVNTRVFFLVDKEDRSIVILGAFKKEAEGSTPRATKRLMKTRQRKYLNGEYE